jgi:uracil-DNA glycosylase family 4
VTPPAITPFQRHVKLYGDGCGGPACAGARVCLSRGTVPCDVLFVGQAPGESEDALGQPFVGPAGLLLDEIIDRAFEEFQVPGTEGPGYNSLTWAFTNLVGCIPRDGEGREAEPTDEQVTACAGRLADFVKVCDPKMIVAVGAIAREWLRPGYKHSLEFHKPLVACPGAPPRGTIKLIDVTHPGAIVRMPVAGQQFAERRCVVVLANAAGALR